MSLPQRQCLILQGDNDWLMQQAEHFYLQAAESHRCWLSDSKLRPPFAISSKQALQQLGRDNLLIILDVRERFSADAFGALVGTLQAGGLMLILLDDAQPNTLWQQRFLSLSKLYPDISWLKQGQALPNIVLPSVGQDSLSPTPTAEQELAINAVLRVVNGHRRRPLVISADRGRGKTALLGMAAAELLLQGKKTILVTAPALRNIEPMLRHAAMILPESRVHRGCLEWQQGRIEFVAPDALLETQPRADLLVVDEAAAIPAAMLERLLKSYSRIVFATTLHGYEGTGRGFAVRFKKVLDQQTPNWRSVSLDQPVRWAVDDRLEQFSFNALLLDAEPAEDAVLSGVTKDKAEFYMLDAGQLLADEKLLREVFGLMVLAHYRTRPSDLQMLLDRTDVSVAVLRADDHIIASAWLVAEPALPDELAQQVFDGKRRLKGQLLPQTLLAHAGLPYAGQFNYQRIIRIAVHPAVQGMGLGSQLLDRLEKQAKTDFIGTSFAMETEVSQFWLQNGYVPVRLGQHQDEVTGSISMIMLKSVSPQATLPLSQARQQLHQQWPFLLQTQLAGLDPELVSVVASALGAQDRTLAPELMQQVTSFATAQRSYESSQFALWQWLQGKLAFDDFHQLEQDEQALLIMLIMQQHEMVEVAHRLEINGKAELVTTLRSVVAAMLADHPKS